MEDGHVLSAKFYCDKYMKDPSKSLKEACLFNAFLHLLVCLRPSLFWKRRPYKDHML
jgi:hypothetical protein